MASLSTCHLGLWLGWQILLNLVTSYCPSKYVVYCDMILSVVGETIDYAV